MLGGLNIETTEQARLIATRGQKRPATSSELKLRPISRCKKEDYDFLVSMQVLFHRRTQGELERIANSRPTAWFRRFLIDQKAKIEEIDVLNLDEETSEQKKVRGLLHAALERKEMAYMFHVNYPEREGEESADEARQRL